MLLMNRDEATVLRRTEITRSQRRHASLLRAIFSSTIRTLELQNVQLPQTHDLAAFIEINSLPHGRSFDPSTLPSTTPLQVPRYVNARRRSSHESQDLLNRALHVVTDPQDDLPRGGGNAIIALGTSAQEAEPFTDKVLEDEPTRLFSDGQAVLDYATDNGSAPGEPDSKQVRALDSATTLSNSNSQDAPAEPIPRPDKALPVSRDDVSSLPPALAEDLEPEDRSSSTRKLHLPSKEVPEERLDNIDPETDDGNEHAGSSLQGGHTNASGLTPPSSDEDVARLTKEDCQDGNFKSGPSDTLKSQTDSRRQGASDERSPTLDEHLRLKETRPATQPSIDNVGEQLMDVDGSTLMPPPPSVCVDDGILSEPVASQLSDREHEVRSGEVNAAQNGPRADSPGPSSGMREHVYSGMNVDSSKELTLSRRPPMRIDTGVSTNYNVNSLDTSKGIQKPVPTATEMATPSKATPATASAQSPPERMTTRVSSGALRHKSVSEILGETPRATPTQTDKSPFSRDFGDTPREDHRFPQTPKSASLNTSPDHAAFKRRLSELKEKERSKLSTVIFAGSRNPDKPHDQRLAEQEIPKLDRDYMLTLFNFQVASPPRAHQLNMLVKTAHKTLTTPDQFVDFTERQTCRVLNRIYEMQSKNCWSLRQIERSAEPVRPVTHLDVMLNEMKWMRTDFREERKWKLAAAKFIADSCAIWAASSSEERTLLQVRVRARPASQDSKSMSSTPDLVHSADDNASEATDEEPTRDSGDAPAAIFSLPPDMFIFGLNRSPVSEKLLLELPLYQPNADFQNAALRMNDVNPDASWKKPLIPVSKYAQGKLVSKLSIAHSKSILTDDSPSRKRRRYHYNEAEIGHCISNDDSDNVFEQALEPEQHNVALFDSEYKHIRDRIHSGHAFRPPSEHQMPSESFFVARQSSQWTQAEDDKLRRNVKDFSYNWSLISSAMTLPSMFTAGAERRTPWECFERWIGLEGLPVEMAKINYFRAYHSRLQSAAQKTAEAQQAAQQHQGTSGQLPRRRTTQPYSVERRKDQKHLHLIDAMRKLAKKRETALSKQQHVADLAAMRKANETNAPKQRPQMHTPQEFSRLKYEKQQQLEEKARQWKAQAMQQQKAAQAMKSNQHSSQQPNGVQPIRNPLSGALDGSSPNMTGSNQARGMAGDPPRPMPQMQRLVNGQANGVLPTNSHGVAHAPMQPNAQMHMQMQQRRASGMGPERVMHEVSRVQAQQQAYQQQIRQTAHPQPNGHAHSPNMQNANLLPQSNASMHTSLQGRSSPSINGVPPTTGNSTSPRMTQPQALSNGMTPAVNSISSQFKSRHPQASPEQITQMTTNQLYKMNEVRQHAQHAMNAAAGHANVNAVNANANINLQSPNSMQQASMIASGGNSALNPAHYAQIMRSQQASQQRGVNGNNGPNMNGSRSATPLMHRPGSSQGGPRPSQSPSARQVGLTAQGQ